MLRQVRVEMINPDSEPPCWFPSVPFLNSEVVIEVAVLDSRQQDDHRPVTVDPV